MRKHLRAAAEGVLRDPRHEEYEDRKTWIETITGGPFDPDAFDVEAVNGALKGLR